MKRLIGFGLNCFNDKDSKMENMKYRNQMKMTIILCSFLLIILFCACKVNDEPVPTVLITSPSDGASFDEGITISFSAIAFDDDGDFFTDVDFIWFSGTSRIGIGPTMNISTLEIGVHNISCQVENNNDIIGNDEITIEIIGESITCVDYDGNIYQIIQIGTQYWMAENLKVTHYRDGTAIPNVTNDIDWEAISTGAYCIYYNDPSFVATYGRLYNFYAVDDTRGLAPEGWHIPTDEEWKVLERYLGMSATDADIWDDFNRGTNEGSKLAGRADLWNDYPSGIESDPAFGISGFTALPGGWREGSFGGMTYSTAFWSSSEYGSTDAWFRVLYNEITRVGRDNYYKQIGFSVRCVRDY